MSGVLITLVALATLLAGAGYLYLRQGEEATEEAFTYLRCPGCNQKLRCSSGKAGRAVMCPRCRQSLRFPTLTKAGASR
jgi:hypothetical protein